MTSFENRLIKKSTQEENPNTNELKKQLKGKALVKFIETHRTDFNGNGDQLCVEAGYGQYSKDGDAKCNFKPFVKELSKVIDLGEEKNNE
tara:strand:+ start:292 stop:561 length:270 start_codon:yes stop_codon:yes gene_type:complete